MGSHAWAFLAGAHLMTAVAMVIKGVWWMAAINGGLLVVALWMMWEKAGTGD